MTSFDETAVRAPSGAIVTRRTLVKGAAWSVPVIAAAVAVPAHAASQLCSPGAVPLGGSGWTTTESGTYTPDGGSQGWVDTQHFFAQKNNPSTSTTISTTTSTTITGLVVGQSYTVGVPVVMTYGNLDPSTSYPATLAVLLNGVTELQFATDGRAGYIKPPVSPGAPPLDSSYQNYTFTFVASGTTATITMQFVLGTWNGVFNSGGDDFYVRLPSVNCP